jgi:hypothetical protein
MSAEKVEELLTIIRARQQELADSLRSHQRDVDQLRALSDSMRASGAFDSEDIAAVEDEITAHAKEKARLEEVFEKQEAAQKANLELFSSLREVITERADVLEEEDGRSRVLEAHPNLLRFLAKKQLNLQEIITTKLSTLATSQGACAAPPADAC